MHEELAPPWVLHESKVQVNDIEDLLVVAELDYEVVEKHSVCHVLGFKLEPPALVALYEVDQT